MIRASKWEDIPQIRELWKEAFGDSEAFLDLYFSSYYEEEELWVREEDGEIVSMATLMRNEGLTYPGGQVFDCPTFYAVATAKKHQGNGYCMELMKVMMEAYQKENGNDFFMIMPADDGLRELYSKRFGFHNWGEVCKKELLKPSSFRYELTAARYNDLREKFLKDIPHISHTQAQIQLQKDLSRLSGGDLYGYRDSSGEMNMILALEIDENGRAKVKEALSSESAKLYLYGKECQATSQILGPVDKKAWGYAGLLFD